MQESKKGNEEGQGKWLDGMMQDMEEEMRHNRQDRLCKKMKRLMNSRVTPADTILDEASATDRREAVTMEKALSRSTECGQCYE